MYLFDRKENKIKIYNLIANIELLKKYREKEMFKNNEILISFAVTDENKVLEHKDIVSIDDINFKNGSHYHRFIMDTNIPYKEENEIIRNYINGFYADNRVIKLLKADKLNEIEYFLLTSEFYQTHIMSGCYKVFTMNSILNLPKSLYLLQKLE